MAEETGKSKVETKSADEKRKPTGTRFYIRALQNDLHIALDGVRYVFKSGQVAAVDKNPGNFDTFKKDVQAGFVELISEDEYNRFRKISARKPSREAGNVEMTNDDFEGMIAKMEAAE